ncbi:MAG: histidine--tRNA ligase [bacterium]
MITKPKGCYDVYGEDSKIYITIQNIINNNMELMNASYIRTPIFEASELFHRSVGETSDIVSKETYDFTDRSDRKLTLRPENTASIVRSLIENKIYANETNSVKLYYFGTMYRYERPQTGRNREFTQFGLEVFNCSNELVDAEVIASGAKILNDLRIDATVRLNTLGDSETREKYIAALKEYIKPFLNDLCSDCQKRFENNPLRILDCKVDKDSEVFKGLPNINDYLSENAKIRFNNLKNYLTELEVDFIVDTNIVRGLDYYTDFVYEFTTEDGLVLGGGGRYDNLVENLGGPQMPATGYALGIERLIIKIKEQELAEVNKLETFILAISSEEKFFGLKLLHNLRECGVGSEMCFNEASLKSQFKMADKLGSDFLILLNDEDLKKGLVTIKDNLLKTEEKVDESEVLEYLYEKM